MDEPTLTALQGSIAKWERIVAGTGGDDGTANCPLCLRFMQGDAHCEGCPVREKTGFCSCMGTPYEVWMQAHEGTPHHLVWYARTRDQKDAAQSELDFLRSLLPESSK